MPSKGLRHSADIAELRKAGLSDAQIAHRLAIGKSIIHRNLAKSRTKERLATLLATAGLQSLKAVFVSAEVCLRWLELERVKVLEGTSALSAENVGTLMRVQEKSLVTAKAFLGKTFSAEGLAKEETPDPRLIRARDRLKELQAQGRVIEEEDDHENHDA
jgi:hypothetical protein